MQTLHRSRDRLVGERTALINQLRATLLKRGLVAPQGKRPLKPWRESLRAKRIWRLLRGRAAGR
jgi:transposase